MINMYMLLQKNIPQKNTFMQSSYCSPHNVQAVVILPLDSRIPLFYRLRILKVVIISAETLTFLMQSIQDFPLEIALSSLWILNGVKVLNTNRKSIDIVQKTQKPIRRHSWLRLPLTKENCSYGNKTVRVTPRQL
jgi:hypothetical protein